ncbi:diguanylate cyclase [Rhodanobacter sp. FW102-FHT14D07]|uniref:diguanylate cyclase n=1 Tax=Rhodanobacter sp. FW102-FHT14D07 TaxID=3351462 RepID=A0AB74URP4_9GAMM
MLLLSPVTDAAAATAPISNDPTQLLRQAENVEPSNHAVFNELMARLDKVSGRLSPQQKLHLRYLSARRLAFAGNYAAALPALTALADQTTDPVLAFRASANVVDLLVAQSRYEEAFVRLNPLLDQLPKMKENDVRIQGLTATAQLYTEAGQYDASIRYADQLIKESIDAQSACRGWFLKSDALFESGSPQLSADQLHDGTEACGKAGDTLFALSFQYLLASFDVRQGRLDSAIRLLQASYPKVLRAGFPPQVAEFESTLAKVHLKRDEPVLAAKFANQALATNANRPYSESTARAYHVLYEVANRDGDDRAALANLEKFVVTNDGYMDRLSAKALAYQIVEQKVLVKKLQVEELDKKNKLLGMQGELDRKEVETGRLYILLLLLVLASIGLWAYRIKRSQLKFMKLARRDGLTGIFNRQHFVNEAERLLHYCRKSGRDACLVLLDLDHFKQVNDNHGHAVGDRVLRRAVEACQKHLRSTDLFGRLGGEEFGMLLPECGLEQVLQRVEQMRLAVARVPAGEAGSGVVVSASFGVAAAASSGYELRQLMTDADDALYRAKREGRNRVSLFDSRRIQPNVV